MTASLCAGCGGSLRYKGGTYSGDVVGSGTVSFRLSGDGRQVSNVKVETMERCGDVLSRPSTFSLKGPLTVQPNGSFSGSERDPQSDFAWRVDGQFTGPEAATGTLSRQGTVGGGQCSTGNRGWSATRKQ
jgi:hypothetical protein